MKATRWSRKSAGTNHRRRLHSWTRFLRPRHVSSWRGNEKLTRGLWDVF